MNHIELFAGCGGMALGLEAAGFELIFANELSPMASETFAYNILGENLEALAAERNVAGKTFWLNSHFPRDDLKSRLREKPSKEPLGSGFNDLDYVKFKGGILVSDITVLNEHLRNDDALLRRLRSGPNGRGVDLVSGGPPCQSFSMAGLRQHDNDRNRLPWEFAEFVSLISPRAVLLENVTGIMRPFKIDDDEYHAWVEVAKAFATKGYVPICLHVNAKFTGTAQNRPRFIMVAVRKWHFYRLRKNVQNKKGKKFIEEGKILDNAYDFYRQVHLPGGVTGRGGLKCHDLERRSAKYAGTFFSHLLVHRDKKKWVNVKDAIDDLGSEEGSPSPYVDGLKNTFTCHGPGEGEEGDENNKRRRNCLRVQKRFRLYQLLSKATRSVNKEVTEYLGGGGGAISTGAKDYLSKKEFLLDNGELKPLPRNISLESYLDGLLTKKQTQKALIPSKPAPAALSIPDDACHYDKHQLRTLTVREMARIQSFPDCFVFRSNVTTGGMKRRHEVPQYTQVGNAVPPRLAMALGEVVSDILKRCK